MVVVRSQIEHTLRDWVKPRRLKVVPPWTRGDFMGVSIQRTRAHFDPVISILRNSPVSSKEPSPTRPVRIVVSKAARTGALDPST